MSVVKHIKKRGKVVKECAGSTRDLNEGRMVLSRALHPLYRNHIWKVPTTS